MYNMHVLQQREKNIRIDFKFHQTDENYKKESNGNARYKEHSN